MEIHEFKPGMRLKFNYRNVKYACVHWNENGKWNNAAVMQASHHTKSNRIPTIKSIGVWKGESSAFFVGGSGEWIIPISELIRIGVVEQEHEFLIFN